MFCKNCGKQINIGSKFCKECGGEVKLSKTSVLKTRFFDWIKNNRKTFFIILGMILFFIVLGVFEDSSSSLNTNNSTVPTTPSSIPYDQNLITSSIVNIICPSTVPGEEASGGSGTIISEDGLILTNSHIIPQDENYLHVDETGCFITVPNPTTGQPEGIYLANPIVLPGISDNYDLAYMMIYAAYYDNDTKEYLGMYPRKFNSINTALQCSSKLGDHVRIFGYPAISGGYSLTITDGIVSSFPGDGLIITSAKISHGNSGGLAINENGCMIGVPSMVSSDEMESLGIIYSMDLVRQFDDEVSDYIDSLN